MGHVLEPLRTVGPLVGGEVGQGPVTGVSLGWSERSVLPEHVHTTLALVHDVHFIQQVVPHLGGPGLQGLYNLSHS